MSSLRKVIIITGVPGVGKTSVSRIISERLDWPHIEISKLAKEERLITVYDERRDTEEVDQKLVKTRISEIVEASKSPLVVEGHFAYNVVPREIVNFAIVLRRAPWVLQYELSARGYSDEKIRENMEAELIDLCLIEAVEALGPEVVCEINTTDKAPEEAANEVIAIIYKRKPCRRGLIDWLGSLETRDIS